MDVCCHCFFFKKAFLHKKAFFTHTRHSRKCPVAAVHFSTPITLTMLIFDTSYLFYFCYHTTVMTKRKKRPLKLQRRKGTKHLSKEDSLAKTLRRSQRIKAGNKPRNIQTSCTGVLDIICCNEYCDVCLLKFPSEDIVNKKYCEVKESLGHGLFAKRNLTAGSYICQYSCSSSSCVSLMMLLLTLQ